MQSSQYKMTATHWGAYRAEVRDGRVVAIHGVEGDPDPSPIAQGMLDTLDDPCRIGRPMVRRGFLERGCQSDRSQRGAEPFVALSWDEAEELVANELKRVCELHGNDAIFAGCYGWASAGRFHHAPSQVHRFLNCLGGYTRSVDTYSFAAGEVILPHVLGDLHRLLAHHTSWPSIIDHTDLVVAFGGLPLKNSQINAGGSGRHVQRDYMRAARAAGVGFVNISPVKGDVDDFLNAQWLAPVPNTDVAIMLGLAHTLVVEGLHDWQFLRSHCVGVDPFLEYLLGHDDGQPKDASWAAAISGLTAEIIRELARRMAGGRTMLSVSWSLTRQHHGEQPYWMAVTLAAMLGQIGLPGGGVGFGYAAVNSIGNQAGHLRWAALDQGVNPVESFIPVARIADMLLHPGTAFDYNGICHSYPEIRLVYWLGGNPFHHHQDINRLLRAWRRPETIIVHDCWWNALARHADIVLPATTPLERNDMASSPRDSFAFAMHQAVEPYGQARNDFCTFTALARRLGVEDRFTEGRDERAWIQYLYNMSRQRAAEHGVEMPTFDEFWEKGWYELPEPAEPMVMLKPFRDDPDKHPLRTPSGKIEIFSETIHGFGYDDCPGHPVWLAPVEWLGAVRAEQYPLHLLSNQPANRLHSQLDNGAYSRSHKIQDREPVKIHPNDAVRRGIADGDIVRIFNDRGACLAGAVLSDELRPGVIQISTGAWYDPQTPGEIGALCKHGNPNVLTVDKGTSKLAQGPIANTCLVEVERYRGKAPAVTAFDPPEVVVRGGA